MKQNSASVTQVMAMDDSALRAAAWTILTNNRQCGGGSVKGRALAQRRIRAMGIRFYAGRDGDYGNTRNVWGMLNPGEQVPATEVVETGVSLDACAHKIGNGNAVKGWEFIWS